MLCASLCRRCEFQWCSSNGNSQCLGQLELTAELKSIMSSFEKPMARWNDQLKLITDGLASMFN